MTPQMRVALLRGLYNAGGAFAVVFLTAYVQSNNAKQSAITAALAALGALGFRGVTEGVYDTGRAVQALQGKPGAVHESDVGAYSLPVNMPQPNVLRYEDTVAVSGPSVRPSPLAQPPKGEG